MAGGRGENPAACPNCGEDREWVDEAMVSGVRGFVCTNNSCPRDM